MPPRWIHEAFDLIALTRSYWPLHQEKDAPCEELGPDHRAVRHDWYHRFGKDWDHGNPFPEFVLEKIRNIRDLHGPGQAERFQAEIIHDYIDRIWDELSKEERKGLAADLREIFLNPPFLITWAGIDVIEGRIQVRYGEKDLWVKVPSIKSDYENLRKYLKSKTIDELLYID